MASDPQPAAAPIDIIDNIETISAPIPAMKNHRTLIPALLLSLTLCCASRGDPAVAEALSFPPPAPLRVLVVHGLWTADYRLTEALQAAGGAIMDSVYTWDGSAGSGWPGPGDQGGGGMAGFPATLGELARYHVVIAANVNGKSLSSAAPRLVAYVRQGGSLLVLGGRFALGKQVADSPLAEILPAACPGSGRWNSDLTHAPQGLAVAPGPAAAALGIPDLGAPAPLVYWSHAVEPKPGAQVALVAGDRPLLVVGEAGKGRAAVYAGTVMGDPPEPALAFWNHAAWPAVAARVIGWLAEAPASAPHAPAEAEWAAAEKRFAEGPALDDLDLGAEIMGAAAPAAAKPEKPSDTDDAFLRLARASNDAPSLRRFAAAAQTWSGDIPAAALEPLAEALLVARDPAFAEAGRALAGSGHAHKTALGLLLLAAARAPETAGLCDRFIKSGAPVKKDDAASGLMTLDPGQAKRREQASDAIRFYAVCALGRLGAADVRPVLEARLAALAKAGGAIKPADRVDTLSQENRDYQAALLALFLCGDAGQAAHLVEQLMELDYILIRAALEGNKPEDRLQRVRAAAGAVAHWRGRLTAELSGTPPALRPSLLKAVADFPDRRADRLSLAAQAGEGGGADLAR